MYSDLSILNDLPNLFILSATENKPTEYLKSSKEQHPFYNKNESSNENIKQNPLGQNMFSYLTCSYIPPCSTSMEGINESSFSCENRSEIAKEKRPIDLLLLFPSHGILLLFMRESYLANPMPKDLLIRHFITSKL